MVLVLVVVVGAVTVAVVLAIAAVAVLRESARMEREPPSRAFDASEALSWVVQHISEEAAATLTVDDVEQIIDLQLEYFRRKGVARNGKNAAPRGTVVVGGSETVDFIVARAAEDGRTLTPAQVHAVIETQLTYLRSIGAIGDRAEDDAPPGSEPDRPE